MTQASPGMRVMGMVAMSLIPELEELEWEVPASQTKVTRTEMISTILIPELKELERRTLASQTTVTMTTTARTMMAP